MRISCTCPSPANEAVVTSGVRTEVVRQVAPWRSGSQHPEDAIEDAPVVDPWHATRLVWQHRPDGCPFVDGEFVAHDSSPHFRGLNHDPKAGLNGPSICVAVDVPGRFWGKPDINRLAKPAESVENDPNRTSRNCVDEPYPNALPWLFQKPGVSRYDVAS